MKTKSVKKNNDEALREHILFLLDGGGAHAKFSDAVADMPADLRGKKPGKLPHSAWMLLDHLRLAQWDILEGDAGTCRQSQD
jgi:hypothetical protein